jgi:hypothetical protein
MATWTQADLDAVNAAVLQALKGKTVSFADRSWTSQDLPELLKFKAAIEHAVNGVSSPGYRLGTTSKGVS